MKWSPRNWTGLEGWNIIKVISCALSYMHHGCSPLIVHWDMSSSNVLLDFEYEARVLDFGMAKLLKPDLSKIIFLIKEINYGTLSLNCYTFYGCCIVPDLVYTLKITQMYDVYSFRVLALEVIKGNSWTCNLAIW